MSSEIDPQDEPCPDCGSPRHKACPNPKTCCIDCGQPTTPGKGSARCPGCWSDRCQGYEDCTEEYAPATESERIDTFIAGLRFPKFAAYAVGQIARGFEVSREDAARLWEEHRKRRGF